MKELLEDKELYLQYFGAFISETLRLSHVRIKEMCTAIGLGFGTYQALRCGENCRVWHYIHIFSYYCGLYGEEELCEMVTPWLKRFKRYQDHCEEAFIKAHQAKK